MNCCIYVVCRELGVFFFLRVEEILTRGAILKKGQTTVTLSLLCYSGAGAARIMHLFKDLVQPKLFQSKHQLDKFCSQPPSPWQTFLSPSEAVMVTVFIHSMWFNCAITFVLALNARA